MTRLLAALCILAVLFTLAVPAAGGPHPFLVAAAPALGASRGFVALHSFDRSAPPAFDRRACLPARAPPLA